MICNNDSSSCLLSRPSNSKRAFVLTTKGFFSVRKTDICVLAEEIRQSFARDLFLSDPGSRTKHEFFKSTLILKQSILRAIYRAKLIELPKRDNWIRVFRFLLDSAHLTEYLVIFGTSFTKIVAVFSVSMRVTSTRFEARMLCMTNDKCPGNYALSRYGRTIGETSLGCRCVNELRGPTVWKRVTADNAMTVVVEVVI